MPPATRLVPMRPFHGGEGLEAVPRTVERGASASVAALASDPSCHRRLTSTLAPGRGCRGLKQAGGRAGGDAGSDVARVAGVPKQMRVRVGGSRCLCAHAPSWSAPQRYLCQSRPMALPKARNRAVIRPLVRGDHPERDIVAARPPAKNAAQSRRRRAAAPPSSPDHAPPGRDRPDDSRHRTRPNPSPRRRRSQTNQGGPRAATRPGSAATTTPAHDHTR
jgi:hypothetical protein